MPGTYKIEPEQNLIIVSYTGRITVDDNIAFNETIINDPDFKKMNVIGNLAGSEFDWDLKDIDKYRAYVKSIKDKIAGKKWALISSGGTTEHTAKIFSVLQTAYDNVVDVKVFKDRDNAMEWLNE